MKLRFLATPLAIGVVAGCALVIDLGDEPKLRPGDSGAGVDTSTPDLPDAIAPADARADTSTPAVTYTCGLPDSPNATCTACFAGTRCCDVNKNCAKDPECVAGLECIKDCVVQGNCINDCSSRYPTVQTVTECSLDQCGAQCTPPTACVKLGACIFNLPTDNINRKAYENTILNLIPKDCEDSRKILAQNGGSDAGACFGD